MKHCHLFLLISLCFSFSFFQDQWLQVEFSWCRSLPQVADRQAAAHQQYICLRTWHSEPQTTCKV